ncbi:hypothetical protein HSRCO_2177 [Halanaeroarchaeum sp. HSR-CO]|nr:hypothetical protein HSRCO_2177 [Halanaeroarchaeum sp. HSR-CO]
MYVVLGRSPGMIRTASGSRAFAAFAAGRATIDPSTDRSTPYDPFRRERRRIGSMEAQ